MVTVVKEATRNSFQIVIHHYYTVCKKIVQAENIFLDMNFVKKLYVFGKAE